MSASKAKISPNAFYLSRSRNSYHHSQIAICLGKMPTYFGKYFIGQIVDGQNWQKFGLGVEICSNIIALYNSWEIQIWQVRPSKILLFPRFLQLKISTVLSDVRFCPIRYLLADNNIEDKSDYNHVKKHFPLKYCGHWWLENGRVLERLLEVTN